MVMAGDSTSSRTVLLPGKRFLTQLILVLLYSVKYISERMRKADVREVM